MLDHQQTMHLIKQAQSGDEHAKETLLEHNAPLLKSIVRHYTGKNVEYDDLFQIACVGFLKAIKNFDTNFNVRFSTYAVPMISGELKRFMRDDGFIKVSRATKQLSAKISAFVDNCKKQNLAEPSVKQIAEKFGISPQEVIFAMESAQMPISIYEKADENDEKSQCMLDKMCAEDKTDDMIDKIMLYAIIDKLTEREKKIIILRYFRDKTQSEIATHLGVSQVQVSRLESKILDKMRKYFNE
ncbi:MAG: SigB/SigF/SigG family RNA polymerase sigma factor [Clostridiales bacterium]|nr:SigB/SigF/SigG family RNA polymerase sigma factor [Clostridiales bacterium]